jgi:hypothetical protein
MDTAAPPAPSLGADLKKLGSKWMDRIRLAEKREDTWLKDAAKAEAMYLAEAKDGAEKQYFNILHSNVETIVPATYNSTPVPDIRRRFGDKDETARQVANILERAITVQIDDGALDKEMEGVSQSSFLAGRGVIRVRLHTEDAGQEDVIADAVEDTAEAEDDGQEEDMGQESPAPEQSTGATQRLQYEAVSWRDFRMGPAKRWKDVPWVAFRHTIAAETIEEWEKDDAVKAQVPVKPTDIDAPEDGDVEVWEVWSKADRRVMFLKATDGLVYKAIPDPLNLSGFFPCVSPVQPIEVVGRMMPVTPHKTYEELATELESVTKRIHKIVQGIKVRGGAAAGETLQEIAKIAGLGDNEIGEIRGVEALSQQGGLDKAIVWWPIEKAVAALTALAQHRETIKAQIYEVTGISDIVRGASNANETARAQEIKTQWGSLRIRKMQSLLQNCVRELFVLSTELISTKFTPDNLQKMTGIQVTPEMMALLNDKVTQFYRINVETDSTISADLTKSRQEMAGFLTGTSQYMAAVGPLVLSGAVPKELAMEVFGAFARTFKLGKSVEDVLATISEQAAQPQQPAQDPNAVAQEAEQARHEQGLKFKQEEHDQKMRFGAEAHAFNMAKEGATPGDPAMGGGFVDKADQYSLAVMQALQAIMQAVTAPRVSEIQTGPDGRKRAVSLPVIQQPNQPTMVN